MKDAMALPMAVETTVRRLDLAGLSGGQTVAMNGGGTMVGFAAVQVASGRGARVIATAGPMRRASGRLTTFTRGCLRVLGPSRITIISYVADGRKYISRPRVLAVTGAKPDADHR